MFGPIASVWDPYSVADRKTIALPEASPAKKSCRRRRPPAEGFLIVVRRSAVLVLWPMFSFDFAFGHMLCSFVEDILC